MKIFSCEHFPHYGIHQHMSTPVTSHLSTLDGYRGTALPRPQCSTTDTGTLSVRTAAVQTDLEVSCGLQLFSSRLDGVDVDLKGVGVR